MEGIGQFDQIDGNAIPLYTKRGRLLMEDERKAIAERRGQCVHCGILTHARKGVLGRKALTNSDVYEGICIRCNPKKVPPQVYAAWDARNRPLMSATVTAAPHSTSHSTGPAVSMPSPSHRREMSSGSGGTPAVNLAPLDPRLPMRPKQVVSNAAHPSAQTPPTRNYTQSATQHQRQHSHGTDSTGLHQHLVAGRQLQPLRVDSQGSGIGKGSGDESTGRLSHPHTPVKESHPVPLRFEQNNRTWRDGSDHSRGDNSSERPIPVLENSQRSIGSALTSSTNDSNTPPPSRHHDESDDEHLHTPSTQADVRRNFRQVGNSFDSFGDAEEIQTQESLEEKSRMEQKARSAVDEEKAALGIFRTEPATKPGVQSVSAAVSFESLEHSLSGRTAASPDGKTVDRFNPPSNHPAAPRIDPRGARSHPNEMEALAVRESAPSFEVGTPRLGSSKEGNLSSRTGDLRLSFQDNYKGDEIKLSTNEYIKQLGENLEDPYQLRRVLHNLRNIVGDDQSDVLHPMKEILPYCAADPRIGDVAAGVLWRTAASSECAKIEVMRSGAIDVLMECLRDQEDHNFCQWSLGVLTSVGLNMENKEIIAEKGGIYLVLDVLSRHRKHAAVLEWGCRCLHNLVYCYHDELAHADQGVLANNLTTIEEAGGIDIIIDAMSLHTSESNVQLWAMKLLWRLLGGFGRSDSRRRITVIHRIVVIRKIVEAGFVTMAAKLLRLQSSSGELLHITAELMAVVLLVSGGESNMIKSAVLLEKATECVQSMIRSMKQMPDDMDIQAAGCRLLSVLSNSSGDIPKYLIEMGAINAIASAIDRLQDDDSIVEAGSWALWKLSSDWQTSEEGISIQVSTIRYVLRILGSLVSKCNDKEIQRAVCGFTSNVSGVEGLQVEDFPIAELAAGFFFYPHDGAADLLTSFCSKYPESSVTVLECLGLARVVLTLREEKALAKGLLLPVLIAAAENSAEARSLMVSAGLISEAVVLLWSAKTKESCLSLLDLISALAEQDGGSTQAPPRGFFQAIQTALDNFGSSNDEFCVRVLQVATTMVVQSVATAETNLILPWVVEKVGSSGRSVVLRIEACNLLWAVAAKNQITDATMLSLSLAKILSFMVEFNGDNGVKLNMDVQDVGAGALLGVAACTRVCPIPVLPEQIDNFMGSVYKTRPLGDRAKNFMVRILIVIWHLCFVHEGALLQAGVIILVMDIMSSYIHDSDIQEKCCMVLAQLSSSENIQVNLSIVETDGVQMVMEAMSSFALNRGVQSEAAKSLSHLSTDDETRMLVSAMGASSLLVNAIVNFREDLVLLERAYSALLNLTSDVPEQFLDFASVVRAVVTTMVLHPDSTSLRENGLGILQNVCMKGPAAKETVAAEGGISTVINEMEKFITVPTVLERAFSTLWSLAVLPANQSRIAQASGINMVVLGMFASIEYERVQQQGCGCIFTLALDEHNRNALRDAGATDAVTLAAKAHFESPNLQTEVCKCLSGLATPGNGMYPIRAISQDEVDAIIFAMQHFPNIEGLQIHGITALLNFLCARNANRIVAANKGAMVEAVDRACSLFHPQCSGLGRDFRQRLNQL